MSSVWSTPSLPPVCRSAERAPREAAGLLRLRDLDPQTSMKAGARDDRYVISPPKRSSIKAVLDLMDDRFAENLTLADLARTARLSRFRFVTVFREEIGISPRRYLNYVRVKKSIGLMVEGTPPADAAIAVGFFDQSHLIRNFRYFFAMTPYAYMNGTQIIHGGDRVIRAAMA